MNTYKLTLGLFACMFLFFVNKVSAQEDSVVIEKVVKLKYFNDNNSVQYLMVESLLKKGKKFEPLKNISFQLYLDSNKTENLISKITTDNNGKAKVVLPASLQTVWNAKPLHTFIAAGIGKDEALTAELEITKAKIEIDTSNEDGVRSIIAKISKFENGEWIPAKDVEMTVGIQRLGAILSAGDEETFTTDSTGTSIVELKKTGLPGDQKGNLVLAAKVEDNDLFGNLLINKTIPWGVATKTDTTFFNQRTLWSTRFRTPIWLLLLTYSIVISVWGTIIYLIMQIIKIKKNGIANAGLK